MTEIIKPKYETSDGRPLYDDADIQRREYDHAFSAAAEMVRLMAGALRTRFVKYFVTSGKMVEPGLPCPWCERLEPEEKK